MGALKSARHMTDSQAVLRIARQALVPQHAKWNAKMLTRPQSLVLRPLGRPPATLSSYRVSRISEYYDVFC